MSTQMNMVIQHLRSALLLREGADPTDGQLLEFFVSRRESAALDVLVRRHGPMVWGVCRRILRNPHDAEDAFQATFLVLVRKAASVTPREMVGNWLYGVARQTALKARATTAKQRIRERQVVDMPEPAEKEKDLSGDITAVLDQELSRLPDQFRVAIVLCDLEGETRKEAARRLGLPEGTLAGRLTRGRAMLAKRLARHGLAITGATLAAALSQKEASACVPTSVLSSTIKAVTLVAAGHTAASGLISARVATLTEGVLKTMWHNKLKAIVAVVLVLGFVATGATVLACRTVAGQSDTPSTAGPVEASPIQKKEKDQKNDSVQQPKLSATLRGHTSYVSSVAYHPDGKTLASGSKDKTIKLWDLATGKEQATLEGHTDDVYSVAYSPDGKILASGSKDETIKVWDGKTGRGKATLKGHSGGVSCLAFSPDSKTLASGSADQTIKLTDVATGKERHSLTGHTQMVWSVAFSPDGKTLASGSDDQTIKLWDVQTGKERATLKGHILRVTSVAFSPDGTTLASGSEDETIKLWDVAEGKEWITLKAHKAFVESVAFRPDGRTLASASLDGTVKLWEVATGAVQATLKGSSDVLSVSYSRDGKTLASGNMDKTIRLWEMTTGMQADK